MSSGATAAAGFALAAAPLRETAPVRRLALAASASELVASKLMERRIGMVAEPYHVGRAGALMRAGEVFTGAGALGALVSRRSRVLSAVAGATLIAGSACTRFGIFFAGRQSAEDPKYTIVPQRQRLERGQARTAGASERERVIDVAERAVLATTKPTGPLP